MKLNKYDYNRLLRVLVGLLSRNKITVDRYISLNDLIYKLS
jgi:hypothetical protein